MDKSRRIFIDLYPACDQFLIISLRKIKCIRLIRNMWHNNLHFYSTFCSSCQRINHLIVQDQIRCHNMHILLGMIQDVEIHFFSYILMVKRTVSIWDDVTVFAAEPRLLFCQILCIILRLSLRNIPHLQEHHGKTLHGIAFDFDRCIFPVSEPDFLVDIFICQIDTSGKCNLSVNHTDFPVIPVILAGRKDGYDRSKFLALDSIFPELLRILIRQKADTAGSVIHQAYFHALFHLFTQDLQDSVPHISFSDNKIFHENKFFCLIQFLDQNRKFVISQWKILCL